MLEKSGLFSGGIQMEMDGGMGSKSKKWTLKVLKTVKKESTGSYTT